MSDTQGNLALKKRRPVSRRRAKLDRLPQKPVLKTKRVAAPVQASWEQQAQQRARAIRRTLVRQRIRLLVGMVSLVLAVAGLFALIVYRQAMILEANFKTVAMERELEQKERESSQIREWLAQNTNLDQIRQQAGSRLGFQDPARSQVIAVRVPDRDRVVYRLDADREEDPDAVLSDMVSTIEAYFKTLAVDQPGG